MLKEIFEKNKDIVINSDIDGFLCGMILQKYYGCKVVGFSNSHETVWLAPEVADIDAPVYIDLYVAKPQVVCIEQHIIAYDKNHHDEIMSFGTKLNPNLERKRTFKGDMGSTYFYKYPFGTVHYLMTLMAREGITVELPDLAATHKFGDSPTLQTCAGQVILRADDALNSTLSRYKDNALDWWSWLDPNHEYPAIEQLRSYIDSCDTRLAKSYKDKIGDFFKALGCDGIDGAFQNVTDDKGVILNKVLNYRNIIGNIVGMDLDIPKQYQIHKGIYGCQMGCDTNMLHAKNLYSYAFIFGPNSTRDNFSFTLNMK